MPEQDNTLCDIRNFSKFLEQCLGANVLEYSLKSLTKPGDHYGSVMQSVDVKVAGKNGCRKRVTLHLVTKTAVTNEYLIDIFQPSLTFVKEVHFYSDIIPAIKSFEKYANVPENERIESFIQCFGSRISLESNAKYADADAVVLLENIKILGYKNIDGIIGFDTSETLAVIKSLAKFHALCIGMRSQQPELFNSKVRPFVDAINMILDDDDTQMVDTICDELQFVEGLDTKLRAKLEKQLKICFNFTRDTRRTPDTPYTTIVHRDLWINNVMIKKHESTDSDDKPIEVKLYDFQLYFYQSFVHDLIFFLFTSVCPIDLAKNFKMFLHYYQTEFVKTLKSADYSLDNYTFDKMWHEIQEKSKMELLHILFMSKLVLADKSSAPSIDEASPETFYSDEPPSKDILNRWKSIIDLFVENQFI